MFENLTVFENLELALKNDRAHLANAGRARRGARTRVGSTRRSRPIGLAEQRNERAGTLSHGQKQWLEIGMLLVQDPQLLLLDEPVAGMTDHETEKTAELIREIVGRHTVVVVEHDMEFVRSSTPRPPCCTRAGCWPRARSSRCRTIPR